MDGMGMMLKALIGKEGMEQIEALAKSGALGKIVTFANGLDETKELLNQLIGELAHVRRELAEIRRAQNEPGSDSQSRPLALVDASRNAYGGVNEHRAD